MFFILSKALFFLITPFNWLLFSVGGYFFWKKEPWRKRFKWIAICSFLFFGNTFIFSECCHVIEVPGTHMKNLKNYDVGIVLTGMAEYNTDLNLLSIRRSADRIWQALTLYHRGKIKKIMISGDSGYVTDRGLHEASQFKEVLLSWGIPEKDIITEERSRNTHENALETHKIIHRSYPHFKNILLITSGIHMRRAKACFDKVGVRCDTYSTDLYTGPNHSYFWDQYIIPHVDNFSMWEHLIKECVGYITYDIVGYI